jgi:hypothetical protein
MELIILQNQGKFTGFVGLHKNKLCIKFLLHDAIQKLIVEIKKIDLKE